MKEGDFVFGDCMRGDIGFIKLFLVFLLSVLVVWVVVILLVMNRVVFFFKVNGLFRMSV